MVLCRISNEALLIAKSHPIHLLRNTQIFTTKDLPNEFGCESILCEYIVITAKENVSFAQN